MAKKLELKDLLEIIPSLTHEELLELKEKVRQEWADRLQQSESDFKLLQNGGK